MQSRVHEPVVRRADLSTLQEVRHVAKRYAVQAAGAPRGPITARMVSCRHGPGVRARRVPPGLHRRAGGVHGVAHGARPGNPARHSPGARKRPERFSGRPPPQPNIRPMTKPERNIAAPKITMSAIATQSGTPSSGGRRRLTPRVPRRAGGLHRARPGNLARSRFDTPSHGGTRVDAVRRRPRRMPRRPSGGRFTGWLRNDPIADFFWRPVFVKLSEGIPYEICACPQAKTGRMDSFFRTFFVQAVPFRDILRAGVVIRGPLACAPCAAGYSGHPRHRRTGR